jgi:glyoxylase-like metal-dependent hydrolase (beta-lactamase superfamily II)
VAKESYRVHRLGLTNVAAYLIYRPGEAILVDSGNSGSEEKILKILKGLGLDPDMLKLLILTHVHFDHAGSARRLKELTGCRIMVHRSEADRLTKGFTPIPAGTRWKAKFLVGVGRLFARRMGSFPGAEPDLLVGESFDLEEFGFPGKVIHTPGHTHGSMVVVMNGGELFAGDTLFGLDGKQHFPPFAEDLPALLRSWELIRGLQPALLYPAHGRRFSFDSFLAEFEGAMERYGHSQKSSAES